jgi:trans-aconitate methyltransferase
LQIIIALDVEQKAGLGTGSEHANEREGVSLVKQELNNNSSAYAEAFKDLSVVKAYHLRPPYPDEVFDILDGLITTQPRRVLDVGAGRGDIARKLVERVEYVDAVDFSLHMIEEGKQLPNGRHPHLRWLYGRVEEVELDPPYALLTAGQSLHWMDWKVAMPRFQHILAEGAYLAVMHVRATPDPWSTLGEVTGRYRTDRKRLRGNDLLRELEQHGLFQMVGEKVTAPVSFVQSIDDYIEAYHSRSAFSRERMGTEKAEAFDREARELLARTHSDGLISLQVVGDVKWGFPLGGRSQSNAYGS